MHLLLLFWLVFFAIPLLFVFLYARFRFATPSQPNSRLRSLIAVNSAAAVLTTLLFPLSVRSLWDNPVQYLASPLLTVVPFIALPVFCIASFSLLIKNKSRLATFACIMAWLYWFFLALVSLSRVSPEGPLYSALYFLCFLSPAAFAFAAGAVSARPTLAHALAVCAGISSVPWTHWSLVRNYDIVNPWIALNAPDRDMIFYPLRYVVLSILAVALLALTISTATIRLLPESWHLRNSPVSRRTWPAFAMSFIVLAAWFCQSVMPYRIPGVVDYSDSPILQILHVEKRGLQFHETCVSVYRRDRLVVSGNERRLLQYRFPAETL